MSISEIEDILPRHQEIADGSKTEYTVAFDLIDTKFVSVYLGSDKQSSGFNIDVENKKIIFDSAPSSGLLVTIVRAVPVSWESTLHGAINSEGINNLLTHIVASIQTVKEEVSRAVKSNVYDQNEGGQLSDFFLKQLTDAQDILDRSENTLSLLSTTIQNALSSVETARSEAINNINSTYQENLNDINEASSTALSSIGGAKDSAIASIENLVTSAEESEANAKVSEANAKTSETNAKASETKAQQIADSIVNDSANKDLSNLSTTGQAKFNAKQNTITGGASTITSSNLTVGRALISNSNGKVSVSSATSTELGYLDGVTSGIQAQLNAKQTTANLSQSLDTSTTKYPSNAAVKAVTDKKANDSEVVHRTGNETIGGEKTFRSGIVTTADGLNFSAVIPSLTKGTAPSANVQTSLGLFDKNGKSNWANTLGRVSFVYATDGSIVSSLDAFKPKSNSTERAWISIRYPANGDPYTEAPTPATGDNSSKIATTEWVNSSITSAIDSKFKIVSELPANPDPNVFYYVVG